MWVPLEPQINSIEKWTIKQVPYLQVVAKVLQQLDQVCQGLGERVHVCVAAEAFAVEFSHEPSTERVFAQPGLELVEPGKVFLLGRLVMAGRVAGRCCLLRLFVVASQWVVVDQGHQAGGSVKDRPPLVIKVTHLNIGVFSMN